MTGDLLSQALAAHQSGAMAEAERLYGAVLQAQPDNADAIALLGLVKQSQGDLAKARELVDRAVALDPAAPLFHLYQGNVLLAMGDHQGAIMAYRGAINLAPERAEGYFGMGNTYISMGDWERAEENLRHALTIAPTHFEARNSLALIFNHFGKDDEALAAWKQVVQDGPAYSEGWLNLCNLAEKMGDYELSCAAGLNAARLAPDNHSAWFGLGVALNRLQRDEEALVAYQNALKLKPDRADIWDNLAQSYQFLNRVDESEKAFRAAVEAADQLIKDEDARPIAEKEYGNRHWHLSLIELLKGDYKRGFARYRARFEDVGKLCRPPFKEPVWQGEDIAGKTVLVMDEQGLGDALMMLRYTPLMKQRGAKIVLSVQAPLVPLLEGWDGADQVFPSRQPVEQFDYYASIFDLPYAFGTTLETIPAQVPYLPVLPPDEKTRLEPTAKKKIGVVWGGSPLHKQDHKRSVPLSLFKELFALENCQFYSMNRDKKEGDEALLAASSVIDLTPRLNNFADAARFVEQMDLIITCDTATAHLAGGMGKPVWTLLPFAPDWRWLLERADTPWYPTMRLFRQPKPRDWASVIVQVKAALS